MSGPDTDMILLFGMPRSGTTWIGKTFDSHPDLAYRHEPDSQFRLNGVLPLLPDVQEADTYHLDLDRYCRELLPRCSPRTCGKLPRFAKNGESSLARHAGQAFVTAAKVAERLLGRPVSWPGSNRGRIAWKSIESVGRLGVLLRLYPNARGVLILRDPRGYAASVLRGEAQGRFVSKDAIANDWRLFDLLCGTPYARDSGIDLDRLKAMSAEQRLAWLWVLFNQKAMDDIAPLANGTLVRYEDLCARPAEGFKTLFEFCGLDWHPQTARFVADSTGGDQARDDYYSVYKHPLVSANRWREELDPDQIAAIDAVIAAHPVGRLYSDNPPPTLDPAAGR